MTREDFPRVLATRKVTAADGDYFGAYLTKTSIRILIDFVNRTFRLRTCQIEIDGSFPVPCTQYFSKRCLAPCVSSICSREFYLEMTELVRLFLRNDEELFDARVSKAMAKAVDGLDFETAVLWREVLEGVREYRQRKRYRVWLDDTVDTFATLDDENGRRLVLVTQRGRRMLGNLEIPVTSGEPVDWRSVIESFYLHHAPREVRVPEDFAGRNAAAKTLSARFGRRVKIVIAPRSPRRVTAERALARTRHEGEIKRIGSPPSLNELQFELRHIFNLEGVPSLIMAFDSAHISATAFAAAAAVWKDGELSRDLFEYVQSAEASELAALAQFASAKLAAGGKNPDLVLVDGGPAQLNSVLRQIPDARNRKFKVIAAVKPKGKHSEIARFISEDERVIAFDQSSAAHRLLQTLRDEAHDLANFVHRQRREMQHHFERFGAEPLIVPIRYDEPGGDAEDLRPIVLR